MTQGSPLRQHLRNLLFLVALATFLLSAGVVGWLQFKSDLDEYSTVMHAQARVIKAMIPAKLFQYHKALLQMTKALPEGDDQAALAVLQTRLHSFDPLDIYYVLDARGHIIQISEEFNNFLGFDPSHMEHVQEPRQISRVFQSVFSKRSVVALQYPLKNGLRLIYERDVAALTPLLEHLAKGNVVPEQSFFILSGEGVAVYHPDPSLVSSRYNLAFDLKNITAPDSRGLQSYLYQNQKYFALRENLEVPEGWTLYLQLPARLITTAIAKSIAYQLAGMLALFVIITLLLQFVLNRSFSSQVRQIVDALSTHEPCRDTPVFPDNASFSVFEFSQIAEAINRMAREITETNARLKDSEAHIRLLLNSTAEAIYGLDLEGRCTFCNESFLRLMGFTCPEELLGKKIHDIIHHSTADGSPCHAATCVAQQGYTQSRVAHSDSEVFWRPDGSHFPVECWSHPIFQAEGKVSGAVVTFLDISERKQAEAEKNAAIARFSTLVESLDALVYVADMESYDLLFINQYGRETWGDIEGKLCWQALQSGQDGPCPFCTNKLLLDDHGNPAPTHIWEFQNTLTGRWYECRDQAIPWNDGRLVRMEIAIDITLRKEAENALASEKERLTVTLRSIGDGVITTDTQGRIVLLNAVAEKMTGWSQAEAQGRPLTEIFAIFNEKNRQPCENPVDKVLASGQIIGLANHTILVAKDGREWNIADSGAPIRDRQSRIIGVVLVFRDVTDQLRMEEERLKIKKLESVGILAGGIAHDFNNILAAILGNLSLAQLDSHLSEETAKRLLAAEKASLRAKDLTHQLLTFSKGGEPIKETAAIGEIIRESASFVLHGGTVACRYEIPEDLWLVDIDKGQMSQVIQNIILNARHAMPEGGEIDVRCQNIPGVVGRGGFVAGAGRTVKITIHDTGVGIPASIIDKIFDPYFTTKQEGSGLGLAITHAIISKHDGHISVRSAAGQGTTFTILLPASLQSSVETQSVESVTGEEFPARVMIMDDEEMLRAVAGAMLQRLGHEVVQARDGKEALAQYRQHREEGKPIDLVIMDLTIPGGMGGKEAVREILAMDPFAKVIVSSGYSNDPIMANCREYGFVAAMVKPFQLEDLARVIKQVLQSPPANTKSA